MRYSSLLNIPSMNTVCGHAHPHQILPHTAVTNASPIVRKASMKNISGASCAQKVRPKMENFLSPILSRSAWCPPIFIHGRTRKKITRNISVTVLKLRQRPETRAGNIKTLFPFSSMVAGRSSGRCLWSSTFIFYVLSIVMLYYLSLRRLRSGRVRAVDAVNVRRYVFLHVGRYDPFPGGHPLIQDPFVHDFKYSRYRPVAVYPVIVREVRADDTLSLVSVARHTLGQKLRLALRYRVRIGYECEVILLGLGFSCLFGLFLLSFYGTHLGRQLLVESGAAEELVIPEINDGEYHGDVKSHEPPSGERVVELLYSVVIVVFDEFFLIRHCCPPLI